MFNTGKAPAGSANQPPTRKAIKFIFFSPVTRRAATSPPLPPPSPSVHFEYFCCCCALVPLGGTGGIEKTFWVGPVQTHIQSSTIRTIFVLKSFCLNRQDIFLKEKQANKSNGLLRVERQGFIQTSRCIH